MRQGTELESLRSDSRYGHMNPFRAIRLAFGLTQVEAAQRSGVSRSLWLAWERKERPITVSQLGGVVSCFSLGRGEVDWIVRWWGDARVAPLTVAQVNALQAGSDGSIDSVDVLFKLWSS